MKNQKKLIRNGSYDRFANLISDELPRDDVGLFSYHIQQLISEIGEVLDADKRWKNFRNKKYDKDKTRDILSNCLNQSIDSKSEIFANKLFNPLSIFAPPENKYQLHLYSS